MRASSAGVGLVIIHTPILLLFSKEPHTVHTQRERETHIYARTHTYRRGCMRVNCHCYLSVHVCVCVAYRIVLFNIAIFNPKGADFDVNTTDGKGHTVVDLLMKTIRAHKDASR
jgi:hypothetical protein